MAVRPIVLYGHPVLREKAEPIEEIDQSVKDLVSDLIDTLKDSNGLGLAAPQIGASKRVFIIDVSAIDISESIRVFINPEIVDKRGEALIEEGCLSFPGIYQEIVRAKEVTVKAIDLNGEEFTLDANGILARAILHEYDHLDGVLFIDYFSPLARALIKGKLRKLKKMALAS